MGTAAAAADVVVATLLAGYDQGMEAAWLEVGHSFRLGDVKHATGHNFVVVEVGVGRDSPAAKAAVDVAEVVEEEVVQTRTSSCSVVLERVDYAHLQTAAGADMEKNFLLSSMSLAKEEAVVEDGQYLSCSAAEDVLAAPVQRVVLEEAEEVVGQCYVLKERATTLSCPEEVAGLEEVLIVAAASSQVVNVIRLAVLSRRHLVVWQENRGCLISAVG